MTEPDPLEATQVVAPAGPATAELTARWLTMNDGPNQDVVDTTAAVNAVIRRWKSTPPDGTAWPQDTVRGAVMLAGRMYRRRNSPAGVEAFGPEGVAYVSRTDPDVAMFLEIGPYARPAVG